jgi:transcriptional regulator with XRE-family HTH domain
MGSPRPHTIGLAEKLYNIREYLGLSQSQMVERLQNQKLPSALKIYAGNISRFEQAQREPPPLVLLAYARTINVAVEILIDADVTLPDRITVKHGRVGGPIAGKGSPTSKVRRPSKQTRKVSRRS